MSEPTQAQVDLMTAELLSNGGYQAHVGGIVAWAEGIMNGTVASRGWFDDNDAENVLTNGFAASQKGGPWIPEGYASHVLSSGHDAPLSHAAEGQEGVQGTSQALSTNHTSGAPHEPSESLSGGGATSKPFMAPFPAGHDKPLNVGTSGRFGRPGPDDPLLRRIREARTETALRSLFTQSGHLFSVEHRQAVRDRTREVRSGKKVPA